MPELSTRSPDNPEFARVLEVRSLPEGSDFDFDIAPDPQEATALSQLMGARSVRRMRFRGRLSPLARGGWELDGTLGASVVQTCVLTLDPVTTRIDTEVRRRFLPANPKAGAAGHPVLVTADEDDEVEELGPRIDLGLIATEALALALPDYPRKPGAELGAEAGPTDDATERPFASLAALRDKLGDNS